MPLGEKVRRLRSQRKWSQQELSRRSKVRQPLISRIESQADAGVSVDVLKKLALTLGCSAD